MDRFFFGDNRKLQMIIGVADDEDDDEDDYIIKIIIKKMDIKSNNP